jgi:hypothetical protein
MAKIKGPDALKLIAIQHVAKEKRLASKKNVKPAVEISPCLFLVSCRSRVRMAVAVERTMPSVMLSLASVPKILLGGVKAPSS